MLRPLKMELVLITTSRIVPISSPVALAADPIAVKASGTSFASSPARASANAISAISPGAVPKATAESKTASFKATMSSALAFVLIFNIFSVALKSRADDIDPPTVLVTALILPPITFPATFSPADATAPATPPATLAAKLLILPKLLDA